MTLKRDKEKLWPAHVNINHQRIISLFKGAPNGSPEETLLGKSNREDNRLMGWFIVDGLCQALDDYNLDIVGVVKKSSDIPINDPLNSLSTFFGIENQ